MPCNWCHQKPSSIRVFRINMCFEAFKEARFEHLFFGPLTTCTGQITSHFQLFSSIQNFPGQKVFREASRFKGHNITENHLKNKILRKKKNPSITRKLVKLQMQIKVHSFSKLFFAQCWLNTIGANFMSSWDQLKVPPNCVNQRSYKTLFRNQNRL